MLSSSGVGGRGRDGPFPGCTWLVGLILLPVLGLGGSRGPVLFLKLKIWINGIGTQKTESTFKVQCLGGRIFCQILKCQKNLTPPTCICKSKQRTVHQLVMTVTGYVDDRSWATFSYNPNSSKIGERQPFPLQRSCHPLWFCK